MNPLVAVSIAVAVAILGICFVITIAHWRRIRGERKPGAAGTELTDPSAEESAGTSNPADLASFGRSVAVGIARATARARGRSEGGASDEDNSLPAAGAPRSSSRADPRPAPPDLALEKESERRMAQFLMPLW